LSWEVIGDCSRIEIGKNGRCGGIFETSITANGWNMNYDRKRVSTMLLAWATRKLEMPFAAIEMTEGKERLLLFYWQEICC
jgi:hypothetical protein